MEVSALHHSCIIHKPKSTRGYTRGVYSLHLDWLSCVFNYAAGIFRHLDVEDSASEIAAIYDFGDDWTDFEKCFPGLEEKVEAMEEDHFTEGATRNIEQSERDRRERDHSRSHYDAGEGRA